MVVATVENAREKLVECLVAIDDAKKYGWRAEDYQKIEEKLLWIIQFLNSNNN